MESNGNDSVHGALRGQEPALCSCLFLDHVGEVILYLNSDGLSWKLLESSKIVSPWVPVLASVVSSYTFRWLCSIWIGKGE